MSFAKYLGVNGVELFAEHIPSLAGADAIKAPYAERDLEAVSKLAEQQGLHIDCLLVKGSKDLKGYLGETADAMRAAAKVNAKYVLISNPGLLFQRISRHGMGSTRPIATSDDGHPPAAP